MFHHRPKVKLWYRKWSLPSLYFWGLGPLQRSLFSDTTVRKGVSRSQEPPPPPRFCHPQKRELTGLGHYPALLIGPSLSPPCKGCSCLHDTPFCTSSRTAPNANRISNDWPFHQCSGWIDRSSHYFLNPVHENGSELVFQKIYFN
jgi:hypothetical protein